MLNQIHTMDALAFMQQMPERSVQTIITSPPYYGLRDYGVEGQYGLETTPSEYIQNLQDLFREAKRVLRDDGLMFINLGDTYASYKNTGNVSQSINGNTDSAQAHELKRTPPSRNRQMLKSNGFRNKSLMMIPARLAIALLDIGWILRNEIIWHKPSAMPESVKDRFPRDFETIYMFSKSEQYYFNQDAVKVPVKAESIARMKRGANENKHTDGAGGQSPHTLNNPRSNDVFRDVPTTRSLRTVWSINKANYKGAHFATYPIELVEICIKSSSSEGDVICDPFIGSGTTAIGAIKHKRQFVGSELNPEYADIARQRIKEPIQVVLL